MMGDQATSELIGLIHKIFDAAQFQNRTKCITRIQTLKSDQKCKALPRGSGNQFFLVRYVDADFRTNCAGTDRGASRIRPQKPVLTSTRGQRASLFKWLLGLCYKLALHRR